MIDRDLAELYGVETKQLKRAVMRIFTRLRQMPAGHEELKNKIEVMEEKYDEQFQIVFKAIKQMLAKEEKPKQKIGF